MSSPCKVRYTFSIRKKTKLLVFECLVFGFVAKKIVQIFFKVEPSCKSFAKKSGKWEDLRNTVSQTLTSPHSPPPSFRTYSLISLSHPSLKAVSPLSRTAVSSQTHACLLFFSWKIYNLTSKFFFRPYLFLYLCSFAKRQICCFSLLRFLFTFASLTFFFLFLSAFHFKTVKPCQCSAATLVPCNELSWIH